MSLPFIWQMRQIQAPVQLPVTKSIHSGERVLRPGTRIGKYRQNLAYSVYLKHTISLNSAERTDKIQKTEKKMWPKTSNTGYTRN